jgi:hypothetical protein
VREKIQGHSWGFRRRANAYERPVLQPRGFLYDLFRGQRDPVNLCNDLVRDTGSFASSGYAIEVTQAAGEHTQSDANAEPTSRRSNKWIEREKLPINRQPHEGHSTHVRSPVGLFPEAMTETHSSALAGQTHFFSDPGLKAWASDLQPLRGKIQWRAVSLFYSFALLEESIFQQTLASKTTALNGRLIVKMPVT